MKANRVYELIVTRGRRLDPHRVDLLEVLDIASGEVVLFWDTLPSQTGKLSRALKTDLAQLEADAFLARWRRYESG